jgi:uncharacterized OB-fold protein
MESVASIEEYEGLLPFRRGLFTVNPDGSGYLIGNRCQCCGITFFPGREFCSACYQRSHLEDVKLNTTGVLYTFTTVYRAAPDFKAPYMVGYIDLEKNGIRIFAPITGCREEDLEIGIKMELVFGKMNKTPQDDNERKQLTYQFRPSGEPCSRAGFI